MDRIFHTWDKWECYPAGFYDMKPPKGMAADEAQEAYRVFLIDNDVFESSLKKVISEWVNSCEHYLTNDRMNRIAWLGQASICVNSGIPSKFRGGYNLLTDDQKESADLMALKYLNIWLEKYNQPTLTLEQAQSKTQADLY